MDIVVPEVGESIFEAIVAKWHVADGAQVNKDDLLCELETDKISLELHAEGSGTIKLGATEGETVKIGAVIATLSGSDGASKAPQPEETKPAVAKPEAPPEPEVAKPASPASAPTPTPVATPTPQTAAPRVAETQEPQTIKLPQAADDERVTRVAMTPLRKKIAAHLLAARQQTAMLTTFNEADMTNAKSLRAEHGGAFKEKHGVKLGFMSFFVRAVVKALQAVPEVNARLDGDDIVFQNFYDIGVAVGGAKGLVVPVLRDVDQMSNADIEKTIHAFAEKVQANKLTLADLEGGTFTVSNGGVYGSMLSTPIINPPQSAVLGMHNIQDRAVVVDGQVVVRPMMYLALSYDHRLIDGKQAVTFLKQIKTEIEEADVAQLDL